MQWIAFTKMHGLGNDFVVIDRTEDSAAIERPAELARRMCDRRRGVGADGVLLVDRADDAAADVRMTVYNADGSVPEMCGNGIRCVCRFVVERGIVGSAPVRIATGRGVLAVQFERDGNGRVQRVTVDMGAADVGVDAVAADVRQVRPVDDGTVALAVEGTEFHATVVSMGNPHAVIFVDDAGAIDLARLGPKIERHAAFPRRINVHFVQVEQRDAVTMRTWERGSGATQACGTGACAVCVAGAITGRTDDAITAHLPGGDLRLRWDRTTGTVFMTGPAVEVFEGRWPVRSRTVGEAMRL